MSSAPVVVQRLTVAWKMECCKGRLHSGKQASGPWNNEYALMQSRAVQLRGQSVDTVQRLILHLLTLQLSAEVFPPKDIVLKDLCVSSLHSVTYSELQTADWASSFSVNYNRKEVDHVRSDWLSQTFVLGVFQLLITSPQHLMFSWHRWDYTTVC